MKPRSWTRLALLAWSCAAPLACGSVGRETALSSPSDRPAVPDRPAALDRPTHLEQRLLRALGDEDPEIRAIAAWFFGFAGEARHAAAIGALVQDDHSEVRKRALEGLQMLDCHEGAPFLVRGLTDGVTGVRLQALLGLRQCARTEDRAEIEACLCDTDWQVRIRAAQVLASMGASGLSAECADLLRTCEAGGPDLIPRLSGNMDGQLAACLDLLTDPAHADALRPLLRSEDPRARFLAEAAAERLTPAAAASRPSSAGLAAYEREREFRRENAEALTRLRAETWREVALEDLVRAVQGARLVVFGETHSTGGLLRDAQVRVLRAWVGGATAGAALGFEPSVERAQKQTIDAARELGLTVIPLEQDWERLREQGRHGARDDEARAAIETWLSAGRERRMFVIRGESHLIPNGSLLHGLGHQAVVILSVLPIPLRARGEMLATKDRVWTLGGSGRIFRWGCVDSVGRGVEKLPAWLEQH